MLKLWMEIGDGGQDCLMGMATEQSWATSREELKRYFSDITFLGHAAAQVENVTLSR